MIFLLLKIIIQIITKLTMSRQSENNITLYSTMEKNY